MMIDANQVWDVPQAIRWIRELAPFRPWFVEEPTSPDDILGHRALRKRSSRFGSRPGKCATTGSCSNSSCRVAHCRSVSWTAAVWVASTKSWPCCCWRQDSESPYVLMRAVWDFVNMSNTSVSWTMSVCLRQWRIVWLNIPITCTNMFTIRLSCQGRYMPPLAAGYSVQFTEAALRQFAR